MKNQPNLMKYSNLARAGFCFALAALAAHTASATLIATDGDIPASMSAPGGTPDNWDEYVLGFSGKYDLSFNETVYVGDYTSWNALTIRNGSVLSITGSNNDFRIGRAGGPSSSSNHKVVVTGAGSMIDVQGSASRVYVGYDNSANNSLRIENGAAINIRNGNIRVGYGVGSDNNELIATGSGTEIRAGVAVGSNSSNNRFTLSDGASLAGDISIGGTDGEVVVTGAETRMGGEGVGGAGSISVAGSSNSLRIDDGARVSSYNKIDILGSNNTVVISGVGTRVTSGLNVSQLAGDGNNSLLISEGATVRTNGFGTSWGTTVSVGNTLTVSGEGTVFESLNSFGANGFNLANREFSMTVENGARVIGNNDFNFAGTSTRVSTDGSILVTGENSRLEIGRSLQFLTTVNGNTFTVADLGLVTIGTNITFSTDAAAVDNYLRLDGGFIAWQGDKLLALDALLEDGRIQVMNEETALWEDAFGSDYFVSGYFDTEEAAKAFSGYDGLADYTIFGTSAIPEPGTYAVILSLLTVGLAIGMKRRNRVK